MKKEFVKPEVEIINMDIQKIVTVEFTPSVESKPAPDISPW